MKFAHKVTNVPGGNRLVTVAEHSGKALVKVTMIPTGHASKHGISQKELVANIQWLHEQTLQAEASKSE